MATPATQPTPLDRALGIHHVAENIDTLVKLGEEIVTNAPSGKKPCCAWDAGSLSRRLSAKEATPHHTILLDMGGTHTKVATKTLDGGWTLLFDHLNDWFEPKRDPALPLLQGFFRTLVAELVTALPSLRTSGLPLRVGVIWSNQIKTKRFTTSTTSGVTGIVHGYQSGGYRKGEWFLKGIHNGDDIGALLLAEFTHGGITPEVLLLGNDTLFTLFAVPGAHAGVVMSSGGNCTLVGTSESDRDELYNSELGGMFMLPSKFLSLGDQDFAKGRNLSSLSLEELSAGNWFPQMVTAHIATASKLPEGANLSVITDALKKGEVTINNRSLCDLISSESATFASFSPEVRATLRDLVVTLVERAASLAGVLTYLSVAPQLKAGETRALVSLDSSMGRYFPEYFEILKRCVARITPPNRVVEVTLVHPIELTGGGDISVPLQGAALALAAQ